MNSLSGLLHDPSPGRADALHTMVPAHSYIVPADVVSGLGDGNSAAGAAMLDHIVRSVPKGAPPVRQMVKVRLSGGEYRIPPEAVVGIGRGDPKVGAHYLDQLVKMVRARTVSAIKSQEPPKK